MTKTELIVHKESNSACESYPPPPPPNRYVLHWCTHTTLTHSPFLYRAIRLCPHHPHPLPLMCLHRLLPLYICWKSNNTNTRLMASIPSLALDPTWIHSHKTLDTAQPCHLLNPSWKPSSSYSTSIITNISTQFLLQSVCVCVCVCSAFYFILL